MSDSGGGIKQFTEEMEQTTSEVVKDVKDEVGKIIEQGVQSLVGPQLTPQQIQQKQQEEQKKLAEVRDKLKWFQDLEKAQRAVREKQKMEQRQKQQLEEQEKQKKMMEEEKKKQFIPSPAKKRPPGLGEDIAETRSELRAGRGKGG